MAVHRLQKPVRIRLSDDERSEDFDSTGDEVGHGNDDDDDSSDGDEQSDADSSHGSHQSSDEAEEDEQEKLRDISFGALAKAQAAFAPSRSKKRKISDLEDEAAGPSKATTSGTHTQSRPRHQQHHQQQQQQQQHHNDLTNPASKPHGLQTKPNQPISQRTSKHAPTVLSSKHRVSRKRAIFSAEPSATKSRDPRFDAAIKSNTHTPQAIHKAHTNYAFLTDYQQSETTSLKRQLKTTTDTNQQAQLKSQIMSLESKIRNAQTRQQQRDILQHHRDTERKAIRKGQKTQPFYLKSSQVRKQIDRERVDAMGKRARDKMEKRKIKKLKGKEGRDLPRFRRSAEM